MILIVTNKLDPHADVVINKLSSLGKEVFRLNTEDFPQKVALSWWISKSGSDGLVVLLGGREVALSEIRSCWYRRPAPPTVSKDLITAQAISFAKDEAEKFLKDLWVYLSDRFWINYPLDIRQAESKLYNLKLAKMIGFTVPDSLITTEPRRASDFFRQSQGNVINKTLSSSPVEHLKDYYFIYAHKVSEKDMWDKERISYTPTLFQTNIFKNIEIRVTVVGKKVFACEIYSQDSSRTKEDWRRYDFDHVKHSIHHLPQSVEQQCLQMMEKLTLNFASFDLILTPENEYVFLELNPNGQWLWIEQLTGLKISDAVAGLLKNGGRSEQN